MQDSRYIKSDSWDCGERRMFHRQKCLVGFSLSDLGSMFGRGEKRGGKEK